MAAIDVVKKQNFKNTSLQPRRYHIVGKLDISSVLEKHNKFKKMVGCNCSFSFMTEKGHFNNYMAATSEAKSL